MKEWILKNLTWLFSGIGVVVSVGIVKVVLYFLKKRKKVQPEPAPAPPVGEEKAVAPKPVLLTKIDPLEIVKEISEAPFLHQNEHANRYCGIRVSWIGDLYAIIEERDGGVRLQLKVPLEVDPLRRVSVSLKVNPADYSGLNLLKNGALIEFEGAISKVRDGIISLDQAKILGWREPPKK